MQKGADNFTVELEVGRLEQACDVLGTDGVQETLEAALREVIALDARLQVIEQLERCTVNVDALRDEAWGA